MILLLNTSIILFKLLVLVYNALLMEGKWNLWNPWYLMPNDKPGKVKCKFCGNVISYRMYKMIFHLSYQYDDNGWAKIAMCSKAHPRVKALFVRCGGFVSPPLNDMEVPTHISNEQTNDVAMEMLIPLVGREYASMFQMEKVWNFTPLQTTQRVLINPQITTFKPFDISLPKGLNLAKK